MKKRFKEYHFDVEMITDHDVLICNKHQSIASHHTIRGLSLKELNRLINENMVPVDVNVKITFIIRGVNF